MRYLVSNQIEISSPNYKVATVQECLDYFKDADEIGVDTETCGFDPYTVDLVSLQLGDPSNQYFIDCTTVDVRLFKQLLETKLLVLQNSKFDLRFLYHYRIIPTRIFDTYLAERTLYLGIDSHRSSYAALCHSYLGIKIDKEVRNSITRNITDSLIVYGCIDVEHLLTIKKMQEVLIAEKGLEVSIELDNRFVKVLAYIEYCGIKLDVEKWKKKIESTRKELARYKDLLDVFIIEQNMSDFINYQQDLFSPGLTTLINWNSPKQVVKFFNNIGVKTKVKNKGKESDTVEQGHLMKFVKEYPIIETYCKYKECQKDLGTYGENWFKLINPVTGRVHTSYKQLMNTGRLSSGGKDKVMKVDLPNMQNIPSDEETRSCFVSEKGHMMISCDYSSQESVVLTNQSLEPNLLEFYDKGFSDMHSFVAKKMFKELNDLELEEIKKNHKNRRQQSKIVSFCLAYGGSAQALADQLNLTNQEATDIYNKYFEAFSQLKNYFEKGKKEALEKGYVTLSKVTGKKCYIDYFEEFKAVEKTLDKNFWDRYRNLKTKGKESPTYLEMKDKVSKYFSKKGDIERISQNYCVQGESSEITKLAGIYFWQDYIIPNNLFGIVKLVNVVHDEWVIEAPNNMIDEVTNEIVLAMEKGALPFCKRVKLKAEAAVDTFWKK